MARGPAARPAEVKRVLEIARRERRLIGQPLFDRGESLPLLDSKVRVGEGRIALCRIDRRGAKPIAELGRVDRARDVVAALLADRGLRPSFPKRLIGEADAAIAALRSAPGSRRDLVSEPTFTVDPASARDFDDAVSARREGDGFRLWIHIADVSAHVKPGGALDSEALARANSTYAPGIVAPMLPPALSDEACSLNPGVERLAVTAELELGAQAEVRSAAFYRSRIRSDARLDYDGLDRVFSGRERPPTEVAGALEVARSAAAALADAAGGNALTVTGSEPEFSFDGEGRVRSAGVVPQTESHRLIERLMILTNEQVATHLERRGVPALYRVHEQPDPTRIELMISQLAALDVPTPAVPDRFGPGQAGELAAAASVLAAEEATRRGLGAASLSSLVLRAMKPARYSETNVGHAGLGISAYSHFTSPIRRYPDLIAHRALLASLGAGEQAPALREVVAAAERCSDLERESMKIERTGDDICLAFLLDRELHGRGWGTRFQGEVSGVVGAGAFVRFRGEMADTYEGFLPARKVRGDFYELNDTQSALVGSKTGKRLGFGDAVEVRVDSLAAPRGRVDLVPADGAAGGGRRGGGGRGRGAAGGRAGGKGAKDKGKATKGQGKGANGKGTAKGTSGGSSKGKGGKPKGDGGRSTKRKGGRPKRARGKSAGGSGDGGRRR